MDEPSEGARGVIRADVAPRRGGATGRRRVRWSAKLKAAFLDHLAATCNVRESAEEIGVPPSAVYIMRRRDPAFAAAWSEALMQGYEMLELQLVGHALSGGGARAITNGDVERTGAIDVDLALKLLGTHRAAMTGKPFKGGPRPHTATREETNAAILRKLTLVEARVLRSAVRAPTPEQLPAIADGRNGTEPTGGSADHA